MKRIYLALFLTSFSIIIIEVTLTRIIAFKFFWHFSYLIISLSMLGLGAAGVLVSISKKISRTEAKNLLSKYTFRFSVANILCSFLVCAMPVKGGGFLVFTLLFLLCTFLMAVPFFYAGVVISSALSKYPQQINRLYFFDLAGAGMGCYFSVFFIKRIGATETLVLPSLLTGIGALLLVPIESKKKAVSRVSWLFFPLAILAYLTIYSPDIINSSKPKICTNVFSDDIEITPDSKGEWSWSAIARIDITPEILSEPRFGGLVSPHYLASGKKYRSRLILQDLVAPSIMFANEGNLEELDFFKHSSPSAAFINKPESNVLVIGSGGGPDVMLALNNRARSVTAVELNPVIFRFVLGKYSSYIGNIYKRPNVKLYNTEGRTFLEQNKDFYDVIILSGVDTYSALSTGAYSLSENYLYTVEALEAMMEKLNPNGMIVFTRHLFSPPRETLRLTAIAVEAMEKKKKADIPRHLFIVSGKYIAEHLGATLFIKKSTFSEREANLLDEFFTKEGFEIIFHPYRKIENEFSEYIHSSYYKRQQFQSSYLYDITPSTDDKPFFFQYYKWATLMNFKPGTGLPGFTMPLAHVTLFLSIVLVTLLSIALILVPLKKKMPLGSIKGGGKWAFLVYFASIGTAFMAIEIVLMQKFMVFLGFPLRSMTIVLFSLLVSSGIGSLISRKIQLPLIQLIGFAIMMITVLVSAELIIFKAMLPMFLSMREQMKMLIAMTVVFPLGFFMGFPFPNGLRIASQIHPTIISWCWGINAFFSIVSSLLTIILSMEKGFNSTMLMAPLVYFIGYLFLIMAHSKITIRGQNES